MPDFQIKRLPYNLTTHAGLSLVGQYLKRFAQIDQVIDPRFPIGDREKPGAECGRGRW